MNDLINTGEYEAPKNSNYWKKKLQKYFEDNHIEDLTDFTHSTCFTYLINLSQLDENSSSNDGDNISKIGGANFLEILISNKKPLICFHFLTYYKTDNGEFKRSKTSSKTYLEEHNEYSVNISLFIEENHLIFVDDENLSSKVLFKGNTVSFYYKYFNQNDENPLNIPY